MIYIGYYVHYDSDVERSYKTSAVNKIKYMLKAFSKAYEQVVVFSVSRNLEKKYQIFPSEKISEGENVTVYHPVSWGGKGKAHSYIGRQWLKITLFFYLLLHAKKDEHVYVYHSTGYGNSILWAKTIKKFKLILEVEEVYSDVQKNNPLQLKNEKRHFGAADALILSTTLLNGVVNKKNIPYIVINGTYEVENLISEKFNDGKIHVVYAGTFDIRKGSAAAVVAAAEHLDDNYIIHICGFGTEADEAMLQELIQSNNSNNKCKIIFHGLLKGREYISFLQSCHIGLSTQNPTADFNATSFPSKILSYLANGLTVVSIKIPAIVESEVGNCISYYDEQTPECIAEAIKKAPLNKDFRHVVSNLSGQFEQSVVALKHSI